MIPTTQSIPMLVVTPLEDGGLWVVGYVAADGSPQDRVADAARLTARERQVAALLTQGLSNKEIGSRLHIEVSTVKNHVHRILGKLHVRRRGEAVARLLLGRQTAWIDE